MRRLIACLAFATVAPLPSVQATTTEEVTATCPVCDREFRALAWMTSNNVGGADRDFVEHAGGEQVFIISCWTCPKCLYTGFGGDFDKDKAPKDLVAKLKKENPLRAAHPIDPKITESWKIPAWVRYDLRLQVLKLAPDASPAQLANVCLRTAQTQRFDWEVLEGNAFSQRFDALFKKAWGALPEEKRGPGRGHAAYVAIARAFESQADPKSGLEAAARLDAFVGAALLYKERGEDPDAERVLASLAAAEFGPDQKAVVEDIRVRLERERKYRQLAIPYFEKHLAEGKPEAQEAIAVRYLLGVLYQRTGDPKKALTFLEPLLEEKGIPEGFLEWMKDEIAKAKAG